MAPTSTKHAPSPPQASTPYNINQKEIDQAIVESRVSIRPNNTSRLSLQLTYDIASPRDVRADNLPVAVKLAGEFSTVDIGLRLRAEAICDIVTGLGGPARRGRSVALALTACARPALLEAVEELVHRGCLSVVVIVVVAVLLLGCGLAQGEQDRHGEEADVF